MFSLYYFLFVFNKKRVAEKICPVAGITAFDVVSLEIVLLQGFKGAVNGN